MAVENLSFISIPKSYGVEGIIPFRIEKDEFLRRADAFLQSQPFAPYHFRFKAPLSHVKGIYLTANLYEVDSKVYARGLHPSGQPFEFAYDVYSSYLQDNEMRIDDDLINPMLLTHMGDIKKFTPFYLTDFAIDCGDELPEVLKDRVTTFEQEELKQSLKEMLSKNTEGKEQKTGIRVATTSLKQVKKVLIPVWLFSVAYQGEEYAYLMDGQTGKIYGGKALSTKNDWNIQWKSTYQKAPSYLWWVALAVCIFLSIKFVGLFTEAQEVGTKTGGEAPQPFLISVLEGVMLLPFLWAFVFSVLIYPIWMIIKLGQKNKILHRKKVHARQMVIKNIEYIPFQNVAEYLKKYSDTELMILYEKMDCTKKEFETNLKNGIKV